MFQTKETVKENRRNHRTERTYSYKNGWFDHYIPSADFYDMNYRSNNPKKEWPY
jgi:hypothetical protein